MKYSIILPVRNGGHYLKECVNGILAQTFGDFNCIVLDNCSTDGTTEWLQSLEDPRIVLHRSDKSLTIEENWSRIKDVPKNEFMTMIGHDDWLQPFYLEEMNALIGRHPAAGLYQTHFTYIDQDGRFVRNCLPMDEHQCLHEFLSCQMARTIDSTGTGYMMRSADYDRTGGMSPGFPNLIFADYALWTDLMLKGYKATASRDCFSYRLHDSLSKTTNGMVYQAAFGKYVAHMKQMMEKDPATHAAVQRYGKDMLLYYCESLSHRLLKTPPALRSLRVKDYIRLCEGYAQELIPGQEFRPMEKIRIRAASRIDDFYISSQLFRLFRRII